MKSIKTSADYRYIEDSLKSLWQPFKDLEAEMDAFVALPVSAFEDKRNSITQQFRQLNPNASDQELQGFVDKQIDFAASEDVQFSDRFSKPLMNQYVMVTFLSHALCEGVINAILAMGLTNNESQELFTLIEKANILHKWLFGPKSFCPSYTLDKGTGIFETLQHLTKRRNALTHNKIHIYEGTGDNLILEGSKFERLAFREYVRWIYRYFSLPYDLASQIGNQLKDYSGLVLHDSSPIVRAEAHIIS